MKQVKKVKLYYDSDCPVCAAGAAYAEVDANSGELSCIDARSDHNAFSLLCERNLDVDQGMVVSIDEQFVQGSEAAHVLAMLAPKHGWFNRMNRGLFGTPQRARLFYPLCLAGRNALLKLRGHKPINALGTQHKG